MKYIEFGIGNTWLVRTEFEDGNGNEYEVQGISGPLIPTSYYLRIWIGMTVFIFSTTDGFKLTKKDRRTFKVVFGIQSKQSKDN